MRVLLVDDEPSLLAALRRMLSRKRRDWELLFAESGDDAIAILDRSPVDVVVSDCRMPGMDGPTLLAHVRDHHPATARIMLSGQVNDVSAFGALDAAQQFIAKPCDPDELCAAIERFSVAQNHLADDAAIGLVSSLQSLPSPPSVLHALTELLKSDTVSVADIAAVVGRDIALSAKLLQLVNSAFFALAHTVSSVGEATTYLGIDIVRGLAASLGVFHQFGGMHIDRMFLAELETHSLAVASTAAEAAPHQSQAGRVFTAGMLHDVGWLVLAGAQPAETAQYLSRPESEWTLDAEHSQFGVSHAAVGAALLALWGLPDEIVSITARHHDAVADDTTNTARLAIIASEVRSNESGCRARGEPLR